MSEHLRQCRHSNFGLRPMPDCYNERTVVFMLKRKANCAGELALGFQDHKGFRSHLPLYMEEVKAFRASVNWVSGY